MSFALVHLGPVSGIDMELRLNCEVLKAGVPKVLDKYPNADFMLVDARTVLSSGRSLTGLLWF